MGDDDGRPFDAGRVLDAVQDVVFAVDADLEVAFVNERFADAAGIPEERLVGRHVAELAAGIARSDDDVDRYVELLGDVLDGERESGRLEVAATTGPIGDHVVETRLAPIERDGEVVGAVGIARDVTRRHDHQRQLEVRNDELAVLNRVLRHDVRNDMAVVEGWLGVLVDDLDGEQRDIAEMARNAARHTVDLTETARDYAAVVAEGAEPDLQPVDLAALLSDELQRHRALYPSATYEVDGDLPAVEVRATPMLQSVFTNLLHNAVQHHDRDGPVVTVDCAVDDDTVTVRVADDGPGLPDHVRTGLFERDPGSLADESASLGLYLVARLVGAYGGSVAVEDNDPRGTVFVVALPRVRRGG